MIRRDAGLTWSSRRIACTVLLALVLACRVPARAEAMTHHWAGGWTATTVAIRGVDMAAYGDLPAAIAAPDGWMYFAYGDKLYRLDGADGAFHSIHSIERNCRPVVDRAMRFICARPGRLLRYDNGRVDSIAIPAPARCNFIAPGSTASLRPGALAPSGARVWFTLPDADAFGVFDGSRVRVVCARDFGTPLGIVPDGGGAWLTDIQGRVDYVSQDRVVRSWRTVSERYRGRALKVVANEGHAFSAIGGAPVAIRIDRATGRIAGYALSHDSIGAIARDGRGRVWIPVIARDARHTARIGLVRIDARGVRFYDLPLTAANDVTVDRLGRLWITDGNHHTYTILTPPAAA